MYFRRTGIWLVAANIALVGCGDDDGPGSVDNGDASAPDASSPVGMIGNDAGNGGGKPDGGLDGSVRRDAAADSGRVDAGRDAAGDAKSGGNDGGPTTDPGTGALATCAACEAANCKNIPDWESVGTDLTKFCEMAEGNAMAGSGSGKPRAQLCKDLVDCAHSKGCADYDLYSCFCGSLSLDECMVKASMSIYAADGACAKEYAAAAETMQGSQFFEYAGDPRFASGRAYALLECDLKQCADECYDPCKGKADGTECVSGSMGAFESGWQCAPGGGVEPATVTPVPAGKVLGTDCGNPGHCYKSKCTDIPYGI